MGDVKRADPTGVPSCAISLISFRDSDIIKQVSTLVKILRLPLCILCVPHPVASSDAYRLKLDSSHMKLPGYRELRNARILQNMISFWISLIVV